jgi:hypothetical protein
MPIHKLFFGDTNEVSYRDIGIRNGISPSVAEPAKDQYSRRRVTRGQVGSPPAARRLLPSEHVVQALGTIAAPDAGEVQCHHYVLQRGYCLRLGHVALTLKSNILCQLLI